MSVELKISRRRAEHLCVALMEWLDTETAAHLDYSQRTRAERGGLNWDVLETKKHLERLLKEAER